jgi:radical SAM superfamily enzyme YgiQ (UPF0313 family)
MIAFETGRIRPPSEAQSILLRITRSCHWNSCAFCPVYKHEQYSIRKVDEIKRDLDAMAAVADRIRRRMDGACGVGADRAKAVDAIEGLDRDDTVDVDCAQLMAMWMFHGLRSVFLQDADALVLRTEQLVEILNHLRAAFPTVTRITSYSRAKTVSRKSPDELKALRAAGLNRIHVGMESGSDAVLSLMQKGVTQEEHIRSGRQVVAAEIELSEYFMPGLGGQDLSAEHAVESATVLNAVNPTFIRIRTTVPVPGTPLHRMMTEGRWLASSDGRVWGAAVSNRWASSIRVACRMAPPERPAACRNSIRRNRMAPRTNALSSSLPMAANSKTVGPESK